MIHVALDTSVAFPLLFDPATLADLPSVLAEHEVAGGAAAATYSALGVDFRFV